MPWIASIAVLGACQPDECRHGAARCVDNVAENCRVTIDGSGGFTWAKEPCAADHVCAVTGEGAVCALDATPDPACPSLDATTACLGDTAVAWTACLRTAEATCSRGTCVDPTSLAQCAGYPAFCATSSTPDPLCADVATACADATTLVSCFCGFRTSTQACPAATPRCVSSGNPLEGRCES
jgi:hypothetical protein